MASNKNKNIIELQLVSTYLYIGIADAGLELVEKRFDQSFAF